MRKFSIMIGLAVVLSGLPRAFGGTLDLTLLGANPTGEVYMKSSLLGGYSGYNFYAGVLDWTDKVGSNVPDVYTYCVDISSVINTNNPYDFNSEPFNSSTPSTQTLASQLASTFTTPVVDGIENLWIQQQSLFQATLSSPSINTTTDNDAEELQIAIWDIIYNGNTGTLYDGSQEYITGNTPTPLWFYSASPNDLTAALGFAKAAYFGTGGTATSAPAFIPSNLMALQEQPINGVDGQNQIYLTGFNLGNTGVPLSVPLPDSLAAFLTLMGGVGLAHVVLKLLNNKTERPGFEPGIRV